MICYKDKIFCPEFIHRDCVNRDTCDRVLTQEIKDGAIQWWGNDNAPICIFSSKPDCFRED